MLRLDTADRGAETRGPIHEPVVEMVVRERSAVADGVVLLTLEASSGATLPAWEPGAHVDLLLEPDIVRQYSLCGDPADRSRFEIAVLREPNGRGGSAYVHDKLVVSTGVEVRGPRNHFRLVDSDQYLFIAGGIGITPILPMLRQVQRQGVDWSMIYVGRSAASLPFVDELAQFGEHVTIRTDDVQGLPNADDLLGDCPDGTAVYACGPAPMLTAIRSRLAARDNVELHFERFAAPPVVDGKEFSVCIASTGEVVEVGAEETLLSALQRSGVPAPYSCQQGFCGTCRTRVLGGTVEHRDTLLTEPERNAGTMLVCISRAPEDERLTLDL